MVGDIHAGGMPFKARRRVGSPREEMLIKKEEALRGEGAQQEAEKEDQVDATKKVRVGKDHALGPGLLRGQVRDGSAEGRGGGRLTGGQRPPLTRAVEWSAGAESCQPSRESSHGIGDSGCR